MSAAKFFLVNGVLYSCDVDSAELANHLVNGQLVPKLAKNLESWEDSSLQPDEIHTAAVDFAGGESSIDSSIPALLKEIAASTDFTATSLVSTGFNLLRLVSDGGIATAVGTGFYFPVPAMAFGQINTAEKPNGILFTNSSGTNLAPTVYFKPLSSGVPTSVTDGTQLTPTQATTGDKTYNFYTTEQAGYIIVSGVTHASTCAHIAWSKRYDEFKSPTDSSDVGTTIALSTILSTVHSETSELLAVGTVSDRLVRVDSTHLQYIRNVGLASPTWTTVQNESESGGTTTYTHSATISQMKSGGSAELKSSGTRLSVDGQTVSITNESSTAPTGYVKYELATPATGSVSVSTTELDIEDWGLVVLMGASGAAYTTIAYAQGIPDNVRALVSAKMSAQMQVAAEAITALHYENQTLRSLLESEHAARVSLALETLDAVELRRMGFPLEISGAGVPSASTTPDDWDKLCPNVAWKGYPYAPGMYYYDRTNGHYYKAKPSLTGAVSDWVLLG